MISQRMGGDRRQALTALCTTQESEAWTTTLVLAVLMTLASICQTLFVNQYFLLLFRIGLHVKVFQFLMAIAKLLP